jgi:hypothetical protein
LFINGFWCFGFHCFRVVSTGLGNNGPGPLEYLPISSIFDEETIVVMIYGPNRSA